MPRFINPTKDILIGTGLGLSVALLWRQYKINYFKKVDKFYQEYDAQLAKQAAEVNDESTQDTE